ncbi:MAG: NUDIX hydrolase [Actinomycetia bacterium]|nr:NUDIX hydrolase [Actinomycetes bacterium]
MQLELIAKATEYLSSSSRGTPYLAIGARARAFADKDGPDSGRLWFVGVEQDDGGFGLESPDTSQLTTRPAELRFQVILIDTVSHSRQPDLLLTTCMSALDDEGALVLLQPTNDCFVRHLGFFEDHLAMANGAEWMPSADAFSHWLKRYGLSVSETNPVTNRVVVELGELSKDAIKATRQAVYRSLSEDLDLVVGDDLIEFPQSERLFLAQPSTQKVRAGLVASCMLTQDRGGQSYAVLMQRRFVEREFWGFWELPQGHLRPGESFQSAAERELFEETGLVGKASPRALAGGASPLGERTPLNGYISTSNEPEGVRYAAVAIPLELATSDSFLPEAQLQWFEASDIRQMLVDGDVFPLNHPMLQAWLTDTSVQG